MSQITQTAQTNRMSQAAIPMVFRKACRLFSLALPLLILASLVSAQEAMKASAPAPQNVDLAAADGTKLKATYFPASKPGPGVILLHQCNQQRHSWDEVASHLAASGIHVLTVDYRGFGESGGTPVKDLPPADFGKVMQEKWPGDIDVAFAYLQAQPGVSHTIAGAGGASCGVNQSIQLARRHPEVQTLVLLSGNTTRDGREFLSKSQKLPGLFSAADDDGGAVEVMQWLYSLSSDPGSKFVQYQTGGHGTNMFAAHKELPDTIVGWYVQTLVKTPGSAPATAVLRKSVDANILQLIDSPGGAAKAQQKLEDARKRDPQANIFSEGLVNVLGYEHMQDGDTKGALEIMKLNASAYPNSPNVYDSLSDAYLADGQRDLARENAKKALQMLASDTTDDEQRRKGIQESAEGKLKDLGEAAKN
jgi:dienelactone hydrolase